MSRLQKQNYEILSGTSTSRLKNHQHPRESESLAYEEPDQMVRNHLNGQLVANGNGKTRKNSNSETMTNGKKSKLNTEGSGSGSGKTLNYNNNNNNNNSISATNGQYTNSSSKTTSASARDYTYRETISPPTPPCPPAIVHPLIWTMRPINGTWRRSPIWNTTVSHSTQW